MAAGRQNHSSRKMVGQVLQPRLNAPVVLTGDEDERIGLANVLCKFFQRRRGRADRIFLVHAVEHRQVDCLGVDQHGIGAEVVQLPEKIPGEADAQPVGAVGAVEDEDAVGHGISLRCSGRVGGALAGGVSAPPPAPAKALSACRGVPRSPGHPHGIRAITLISKSKPASQLTPTAVHVGYGAWGKIPPFTSMIASN